MNSLRRPAFGAMALLVMGVSASAQQAPAPADNGSPMPPPGLGQPPVQAAPTLGQAPAQAAPNPQPRLRVLRTPLVAQPTLLLPDAAGNQPLNKPQSGPSGDQPNPSSGNNLFPHGVRKAPEANATPATSAAASNNAKQALPSQKTDFNPRPFLASMVRLRLTANTCNEFLPNSPVDATNGIVAYFSALKQPTPTGRFGSLHSSLDQLVRSQAASVCQDRMNKAVLAYQQDAGFYDDKKPAAWPAAPDIKPTQWCATPNCIEVK